MNSKKTSLLSTLLSILIDFAYRQREQKSIFYIHNISSLERIMTCDFI